MTDETEDTTEEVVNGEPVADTTTTEESQQVPVPNVEGLQSLIDAAVAKAMADKGLDPEQVHTTVPKVPTVDKVPETPEEVQALADAFALFRGEVAAMRKELAAARSPQKFLTAVTETIEDRTKARMQEIMKHSHYCPECGLLYDYLQQCKGKAEGGHLPAEVVSTNELAGDPALHTAARNTDVLAA